MFLKLLSEWFSKQSIDKNILIRSRGKNTSDSIINQTDVVRLKTEKTGVKNTGYSKYKNILSDVSPDEIKKWEENIYKFFNGTFSLDYIQKLYYTNLPGYNIYIQHIGVDPDFQELGIELILKFRDKENAGELFRVIEKGLGDTLNADHRYFYLEPNHRNKGLSIDINKNTENGYKDLGVSSIHLYAGDIVGGYAWALQGYNFLSILDRDEIRHLLETNIKENYSIYNIETYQIDNLIDLLYGLENSWEFALWNPLNEEYGNHLGKKLMLGTRWKAIKYLNDLDLGYQIGMSYYEYKKSNSSV